MLARASAQAGDGAGALFARLDAADAADAATEAADAHPASDRRRAEAERLLARWAARIHAGEWNDGVGALVALALALEQASPATSSMIAEKVGAMMFELSQRGASGRGLPSTN
jgi:hypothetical protein